MRSAMRFLAILFATVLFIAPAPVSAHGGGSSGDSGDDMEGPPGSESEPFDLGCDIFPTACK